MDSLNLSRPIEPLTYEGGNGVTRDVGGEDKTDHGPDKDPNRRGCQMVGQSIAHLVAVKEHGERGGDPDGRRRRKEKGKKGRGSSGLELMVKTIVEDNVWSGSLGRDAYLVGRGQVMAISGAKAFSGPDFRRGRRRDTVWWQGGSRWCRAGG